MDGRRGSLSNEGNIITLLQTGAELIGKKTNRDVVLLVGNTGSGKSTLAQYIVGHLNHLTSVKRGIDYVIVDDKEKVSRSTIISKTLYPELIEDSETDTNYYDCPGFSDTRSAAHEITATYFTKKIIDSARSVKLVFTVNHSSVREGVNRNDFMELLNHATSLIKDIYKFKNSIMLVVTKVEQLAESDDEIVYSIANFIESVKTDLEQNTFPSYHQNFCTKAIEFIDAIMVNDKGCYQKIGIFKRPKFAGKLITAQSYKSERDVLNKMLKENIQYAKVNIEDFGFTVSDKTKNNISKWVEEVCTDIVSELEDVEGKIINYFKDQEKLYSLKTAEAKSLFNDAHDGFNQILKNDNTKMTSQELIEKLVEVIENYKIHVVLKSLFLINSYENYLEFLYLFSKQSKPKNGLSYLISGALSNVTKYLDESNRWYNFLYIFYSRLGDYRIQKETSKYNIISIEDKINQHQSLEFKYIQALIQDIIDDCNIQLDLIVVRDLLLNKYKLNSLTNVLKYSLGHKIQEDCPSNILTIKGHYLKLSDVDKIIKNCRMKIEIIEILALHKIFIDTDLNKEGEKLGLIIISPLWDIIHDSKIILDGATRQSILTIDSKLMNQTDSKGNGLDGQPGRPGGPAGTFFAIGKTFFKSDKQNLQISAVGGSGENGGNGSDGKDGEDGIGPASLTLEKTFHFANGYDVWRNKKFNIQASPVKKYIRSSPVGVGEFYFEAQYTVYGRNATPGGNGGNAGAGGAGGNGGSIIIIGLKGNSGIKIKNGRGKNGENGKPGKGGKAGKNSELIKVSCNQGSNDGKCKVTETTPYGGTSSSGKPGQPVRSTIESLEIVSYEKQYPLSINKFKSYLISNLKNSLDATFLMDFFKDLEKHEEIINCYDVLSLTDELQGLESQYYILHNEISLLPFYHSLLNRILNYAKKLHLEENSAQYKEVLLFLHTTILSKLSSINNSFDSKLVVDVKAYLDLIERNIDDLKTSYHQLKIEHLFNINTESLENKIKNFNGLIETKIKPDIEDNFKQIRNSLETLLTKELNDLEIKVTKEKDQLSYKQKEMERILAKKKVIDTLQIASYFLLSLSGVGITAISVIEQSISISRSFVSEEVSFSDVVIAKIPEGVTETSKMIQARDQLLFKQLSYVNQELINFKNDHSSQQDIKYELERLEKNMKENENAEEIEKLQERINEMITSKIERLKKDNNLSTARKLKLKTLETVLLVDPDLFDSFKENQSQIEVLGNAINQADAKLREISIFHDAVYKIVIPKFADLKCELQKMLKKVQEKSYFPIEVSKWKIQNTINECFTLIYKMTKGFSVEENIMSSIKKLKEGMTAIIDIYKTIDNYQSERQLHAFLKLIHSKKSLDVETNDEELSSAKNKLDTMVQCNLVLSQYQKAISMFKQYIFPFAHFYLSEFSLPIELEPERNIETLALFAARTLKKLKTRITESNLSIGSFDKNINSNILFSSNNNKFPFFTWSYDKHKDAISKLLQGKKIFLEADITKIRNINAVKFKVVGLKFKASDKNIQNILDKKLDSFDVHITHLGSSNYRCGNKIYIIKHDKIHFLFSMKISDGVPIKKNKVYDKIKENDFMFSPYTMWSIKLNNTSSSFDELKEFSGHEINLELEGIGQYVDDEINKSVCVDEMKNYYTINEIMSDIETVEETYLNNTLKDNKNSLMNHFKNIDYKRERRQLKNIYSSTEGTRSSFMSNGGSSIFRDSLISNLFNFAGRSFESLRYLNPLNYISSWFELPTTYDTYNPSWRLSSKTTDETNAMRHKTLMNFHSNLMLWDFVLKKYLGLKHNPINCNETLSYSEHNKLKSNESCNDFASSLAYNYYFKEYNEK